MQILKNVPMEEYRAWEEDSQSDIKKAWASTAHYLVPFASATHFDVGLIVHHFVLENHLPPFWVVAKPWSKNSNKYKDWAKEQTRQIVNQENVDFARQMHKNLMANRKARVLIESATDNEISSRGRIEGMPFDTKGRADQINGTCILDLKSTKDASPAGWRKSIYSCGYDLQCATYLPHFDRERFIWICVENKPPFNVATYEMDELCLKAGQARLAICSERVQQLKETGLAESYQADEDGEILKIGMGHWDYKKIFGE